MRIATLLALPIIAAVAFPSFAQDVTSNGNKPAVTEDAPAKIVKRVSKVSVEPNPGIDNFETSSVKTLSADADLKSFSARGRKSKRALMWPTGLAF